MGRVAYLSIFSIACHKTASSSFWMTFSQPKEFLGLNMKRGRDVG